MGRRDLHEGTIMSFNKDTANNVVRRLAGIVILIGLWVGILLPFFEHNFTGLIIGPCLIAFGMFCLALAWWKRPRWENRDPKR